MSPIPYKLRALKPNRLISVAKEWQAASGADEFDVELSTAFEWFESHLLPREGDGHAMELFNLDDKTTDAIIEVVDSKRGALYKLLKLWISPALWDSDTNVASQEQVRRLHAAAIALFLGKGINGGFDEVKIYGRTDHMLGVLKMLQSSWDSFGTGWSATIAGRWLAISRP